MDIKQFSSSQMTDQSPDRTSALKIMSTGAIGATLLVLAGLTITGTVMALIIATPLVVLFSPILVPAGIVMSLAAIGLVFSGGCGVAAISALTWLYRHVSNYIAMKQRSQAFFFY